MSRVAGVDPGTVSFDVCVLDDGEVALERSFSTEDVGADPAPLVETLVEHGPFDLVLGPAGYGLPLVPAEQVGERELELMVLVRADEPHGPVGVGGMRSIVRIPPMPTGLWGSSSRTSTVSASSRSPTRSPGTSGSP